MNTDQGPTPRQAAAPCCLYAFVIGLIVLVLAATEAWGGR